MQVLDAPRNTAKALQASRILATLMPRLSRAFREQLRPTPGISMPQFITLRALRHGPLSAGQLAERFGVSRPTITRMVDGLVKKGLVERHAGVEDRRVALTSLTNEGRALHKSAEESAVRSLCDLLSRLSEDRLERLELALGNLVELLELSQEHPEREDAPFNGRFTRL